MYVCMYVCMYVYIYIYVYIHVSTCIYRLRSNCLVILPSTLAPVPFCKGTSIFRYPSPRVWDTYCNLDRYGPWLIFPANWFHLSSYFRSQYCAMFGPIFFWPTRLFLLLVNSKKISSTGWSSCCQLNLQFKNLQPIQHFWDAPKYGFVLSQIILTNEFPSINSPFLSNDFTHPVSHGTLSKRIPSRHKILRNDPTSSPSWNPTISHRCIQ